jgi:hypothetical protein
MSVKVPMLVVGLENAEVFRNPKWARRGNSCSVQTDEPVTTLPRSREMSLRNVTSVPVDSRLEAFARKTVAKSRNGLRERRSHSHCRWSSMEVFEMTDVLSECDPGLNLAGRQGFEL